MLLKFYDSWLFEDEKQSVAELQLQGAKRRKRKAVNGQPATATQRPEGRIARLCGKKESM